MIRRLLVANRGEIALRIVRACREMGIESVAVHSAADARAPHTLAADLAVPIGPAPAAQSYLSIPALIDAARRARADAIHPGYGFLAEDVAFAAACEAAGLVFVGPPAPVMARMGSKIEARRAMAAAGVPLIPGEIPDDQSDAGIRTAVGRVGCPALLKPSAGGGGKGMRVVHDETELDESVPAARREAVAAFGNGTLYVERLLLRPRHVEIQVVADAEGRTVHLFERECSVQRRHQKIIEESPSVAVTPALRARMCEAAVVAAQAVGYRNAGTIEFLVEGTGDSARFHFLEMNTRLQVEHPVTEAVTGVDLVRTQILLAAGAPLPWRQADVAQRGHAIECRVYAEDPATGFLPQAGLLLLYREPGGPGIRIDAGVAEGDEVSVHYDPLLAKLIASGESRAVAHARAAAALRRYAVLGIRTNVPFLLRILSHPRFEAGEIDIGFVDREERALVEALPREFAPFAMAAAAWTEATHTSATDRGPVSTDPWSALRGWRL